VVADRMVCKIPLERAGRIFPTNLVILEGEGVDIIMAVRWMKMHKDLLDISAHLVLLDSLVNGKVTLHLPAVARLQAANIRMCFLMNYRGCHPTQLLSSRLSCNLERLQSQSGCNEYHQMNW
jgi:hypothetical protein